MKRVVIVGAGAMGCLFAAKLALVGADVTLVDVHRARLSRIAENGFTLRDDGGEHRVSVRARVADEVSEPADLVLLFTKAMHTAAAVRSVAQLNDGHCCALTLQNGLGNAEAIAEVFPVDRTLLGVTDWPADPLAPDGVASHGSGHVWLGGLAAAAGPHASEAARLLSRAGLNADHHPDVHSVVWEKAAFNAAVNALTAITRLPVGGLDRPEGRRIALLVADEAIAAAAFHGIAMDRDRLIRKIDFALARHGSHKPSMLQDRLAGRPTEIDAINGQIVRAAEAAGTQAIVTSLLADLVRMGDPGAPTPSGEPRM